LEKTILVGIITKDQTYEKSIDYLEELAFLTETAGGIVDKIFTQKLINPNPKTFIGEGKINEIYDYVKENKIMTVIFDDELSATQERNISKIFNCKILDRTNLILDIFAQRAKTSYAKTQVELAQCEYLLPRLKGMWTHLERQKGGIGMRGPGETEIETDRRIVRNKISLLKNKIKSIDKQMHVQRGNRGKLVRVAIVGYTNVGKSTLMNLLCKSKVFAENKLFATLDTTVRKLVIGNLPFLISDTVGFIRKLPTQLVESFKSTLDEVREADLLVHVVDITHSNFEEHKESVEKILSEIESINKPTILVFNKIDNYAAQKIEKDDLVTKKTKIHYSLQDWRSTWMSKLGDKVIFISAKSKINIDELKKVLYSNVREIHVKRFPYNHFLFPDFDEK
tara:strand:- start:780 stop:1964 length:1185 start_codon:yes stop_codon:yes gene_type:complete